MKDPHYIFTQVSGPTKSLTTSKENNPRTSMDFIISKDVVYKGIKHRNLIYGLSSTRMPLGLGDLVHNSRKDEINAFKHIFFFLYKQVMLT